MAEHTHPARMHLGDVVAEAWPALGLVPAQRPETGPAAVALQRWLVHAVEAAVAPRCALRERLLAPGEEERRDARARAAAALAQAAAALDDRQIRVLASGAGVAEASLGNARREAGECRWNAWLQRIVQLAYERLLSDPVAPELLVELVPLEPGDLEEALAGSFTHAVVCGELLGFAGELFPLVLDARDHELQRGGPGIQVVGVHHAWLTESGAASRAIFFDPGRDALVEASFSSPLPVHGVQFLCLGAPREQERHRALSARLSGRVQANPYPAAALADSKWETTALLEAAGVPTPAAVRIPASAGPGAIAAALDALGARAPGAGVVVQPDRGTEGQGVACFAASAAGPDAAALEHVRQLQRQGDVLVRACVGGRRWRDATGQTYSADLRVNVAWDGERYRAGSGYLQVARDPAAFASSVGRGGRIVKLSQGALEGLGVGPAEREAALETACAAARALAAGGPERLALIGLDLKLERGPAGTRAWVLDANPRPAGLSHAELFETGEPGVATCLWAGLLASHPSTTEGRAS